MSATPFIQSAPYRSLRPHTGARYARPVGAARKFAQGAGSALLVFAGADSMTANASAAAAGAPAMVDFSSMEGLLQTMFAGSLSGPLQIIAATFLFLAAGRCVARFLGLAVGAVVLLLYMQGVTLAEVQTFVLNFMERLSAAASAFQTAEVA